MLSLRSVNALSHNTDWTVAHVHSGALGWVGFMCFGMLYWLVPKLTGRQLWAPSWASWHFWLGSAGLIIYIVSMWAAGLMEGLLLFQFDDNGLLAYEWADMLDKTYWLHHVRLFGGVLYLLGMVMCLVNLGLTGFGRATVTEVAEAAPLQPDQPTEVVIKAALSKKTVEGKVYGLHDGRTLALLLTAMTLVALSIGGAFEILPNMIQGALSPKLAGVKPYSPLELAGRDIYIAEGCVGCHTQMVRTCVPTLPVSVTRSWASRPTAVPVKAFMTGRSMGSKRTGPDRAREGILRPDAMWHYKHFHNTQASGPEKRVEGSDEAVSLSIMPNYPQLFTNKTDFAALPAKMTALSQLPPYPYSNDEIINGAELARAQAQGIADDLADGYAQWLQLPAENRKDMLDMPAPNADMEVIAVIAYLQKLGRDLKEEHNHDQRRNPTCVGGSHAGVGTTYFYQYFCFCAVLHPH